jgi:hypothetical protein
MSEPIQVEALATATDYVGLVTALRIRADAQKIVLGSEEIAELTGLPDRYLSKVFCSGLTKKLGMISLGPVLTLLGVKLAIVDDPEAAARMAGRITAIKTMSYQAVPRRTVSTRKNLKEWGRLGGLKRAEVTRDAMRKKEMQAERQRRHRARIKAEAMTCAGASLAAI